MKLGLIGCGKMGTALLEGILNAGLVYPELVSVYDSYAPSIEGLVAEQRVVAAGSISELVERSELIFVCVKPADVLGVLDEAASSSAGKLFVSIAAGMTLARMEAALPETARVVRVMPNTPAVVGKAASAYALGQNATEEDAKQVQDLLEEVGVVVRVEESDLDAVTGLSGSGPAYIYSVIEALAQGGVEQGLNSAIAL